MTARSGGDSIGCGRSLLLRRVRPADGDHHRRNEVSGLPALHDTAGDQRPRRHQTAARAGDAALRDDLRYDDAHTGVLLLAGAFVLWRPYRDRVLTVVSTLFGAGAFLVGIFPGNTTPHAYVAMIAFVFSPLTAIAAFRVTSAPFRFMSLSVGLLSLAALIAGELGDNSTFVKSIGIGGTERWQVFPMILWLAFFGGYLLASRQRTQPDGRGPAAADGSADAPVDPHAVVPSA